MPSTVPKRGMSKAVSEMTDSELMAYRDYGVDGNPNNGLAAMVADGRADAEDIEDMRYISQRPGCQSPLRKFGNAAITGPNGIQIR